MPPKQPENNGTGWKLLAFVVPIAAALLFAILAGMQGDIKDVGTRVYAHESLTGHPGTLSKLESFQHQLDRIEQKIDKALEAKR